MFRSSGLCLRVEDSTLGSLHCEDELRKLSAVPLASSGPQEHLLRVRIGNSTTAFETDSNDRLWPITAHETSYGKPSAFDKFLSAYSLHSRSLTKAWRYVSGIPY